MAQLSDTYRLTLDFMNCKYTVTLVLLRFYKYLCGGVLYSFVSISDTSNGLSAWRKAERDYHFIKKDVILYASSHPFFSQNEPQKTFVIKRTCLVIVIPMWHLEPAFRQSTHIHCQAVALTVKDLDRLLCLTYKDESLVLGKVAAELLIHYTLQTLELLSHINRLHAQVVSEVCM